MRALAAGCVAVGLTACGGSGGDGGAGGQLELQAADAGDASIGSGSLQVRKVVLHNGSSRVAKSLRVQVAPDAQVLQLPLACEAGTQAVCQVGADGVLTIDQLAAGASLTLQQQLRVKAGYRGAVSNAWAVSSSDATLAVQWRQALTARVADVGLTMQSVSVSGADADRKLTYVLTISNAGPDEARDVLWNQIAGIDMPYQGAKCTASGGAVCPSDLGESIKISNLPKGGSLSLELSYGGRTGATDLNTEMLFSELRAAGDPSAANDRVLIRQPDAPGRAYTDGIYDLLDFEGHVGRLTVNFQVSSYRELRFETADKKTAFAGTPVDVTGFVQIRRSNSMTPWPFEGTFGMNVFSVGVPNPIVGSFDFGQGLKPFLAARDWVTDLSELEGISYTLLGSRADATGKPTDAFARTARFVGAVMSICEAETLTAIDVCPASQLRKYDAAIVGREVELMSGTEAFRLRAVRTTTGPTLIRSERVSGDSASVFWIGVPALVPADSQPLRGDTVPSTFASASGLALDTSIGFELEGQNQVNFLGHGGLPNSYLLYFQQYQDASAGYCTLTGTAQSALVNGLYEGSVNANAVIYPYGTTPPSCYEGAVYFALSGKTVVMLGKAGGALGGRWLIATE